MLPMPALLGLLQEIYRLDVASLKHSMPWVNKHSLNPPSSSFTICIVFTFLLIYISHQMANSVKAATLSNLLIIELTVLTMLPDLRQLLDGLLVRRKKKEKMKDKRRRQKWKRRKEKKQRDTGKMGQFYAHIGVRYDQSYSVQTIWNIQVLEDDTFLWFTFLVCLGCYNQTPLTYKEQKCISHSSESC